MEAGGGASTLLGAAVLLSATVFATVFLAATVFTTVLLAATVLLGAAAHIAIQTSKQGTTAVRNGADALLGTAALGIAAILLGAAVFLAAAVLLCTTVLLGAATHGPCVGSHGQTHQSDAQNNRNKRTTLHREGS
jgi:hypothetical protein